MDMEGFEEERKNAQVGNSCGGAGLRVGREESPHFILWLWVSAPFLGGALSPQAPSALWERPGHNTSTGIRCCWGRFS